ncbi:hypothetical protein PTKIN_Ptkin07bG0097400 [Pterospermum kingtungense]
MAVEDIGAYNNDNNKNLSLPLPANKGLEESQLCVPQDCLDDIDWFPNFTDDIISLDAFFISEEEDDASKKKRGGGEVEQTIASTNKKQRSKRVGKRGCWSTKHKLQEVGDDESGLGLDVKKKCSHCLAEKTPQWRMGPLGPKTLCNACGVRYKSGRLLPEYRPAASPTFDAMKHSSFHKKIIRSRDFSG